jgi:hypothetical protein
MQTEPNTQRDTRAELRQGDDDGLVHNHEWATGGK